MQSPKDRLNAFVRKCRQPTKNMSYWLFFTCMITVLSLLNLMLRSGELRDGLDLLSVFVQPLAHWAALAMTIDREDAFNWQFFRNASIMFVIAVLICTANIPFLPASAAYGNARVLGASMGGLTMCVVFALSYWIQARHKKN